ncbi:MAG: ADP-ribosyltransferase [Clostridia bacterium]
MPVIDSIGKNDLTYDEEYAIRSYVSSESYKINDKLRNNIKLNEQDNILIKNLDSALEKCYNYNGSVIRTVYISESELKEYLKDYKIGEKYTSKQYLSFSNKTGYNEDANIIIHIASKYGKNIRKYNEEEGEILYQRNSIFIIDDIVKKDKKIYMGWSEKND